MTDWICPKCGHDHTEPPWRAGDEDICNLTMGPFICGCTYLRLQGPSRPPPMTLAMAREALANVRAPKPPKNRGVS